MRIKGKGWLLLGLGLFLLIQAGGICWSQSTERVSVDTTGSDGDNASNDPSTSSNGRYVAFESFASDLVANDIGGNADVFVRDRQTATTTRVSVDSGGNEGNLDSSDPSITGDGRHVAFESFATNLVASGGDAFPDIFVHDRDVDEDGIYDEAGEVSTVRVSVDSAGNEQAGPSLVPSISGDGRYVAFQSDADLVGTDTNGFIDIYVHDRDADEDGTYDEAGSISTVRVSVHSDGTEGNQASSAPSISADGRYVAFESITTNLVPGGSNGFIHIFVHDRDADGDGIYDEAGGISTAQVSVDSAGSEGNADSGAPSISADGRYVAFESIATNLVPGGSNGFIHIFVHDRDADGDGIYDEAGGISTAQVSVDSAGTEGDAGSGAPSISADGRYVAFESDATNLVGVGNDTNGSADVFVHDLQTGTTTRVSVDTAGNEGNGISRDPSISADSKYVAFESDADNLVANDNNGFFDIFLYERESLPPTVTSTNPDDNGDNFAVDAAITATFSEAMQVSTINSTTFTLDNGVTGTVSYDGNSATATFTPTSNLDYDTTYTATITTGAEDLAGNGLQAPYLWSFTTQSEENSGGNGVCFIATAAHGTSMAGQVRVMREVLFLILLITTIRFSYNRLRPHEK